MNEDEEEDWTERSLYYTEFDRLGEHEVRRKLNAGLMVGDNLSYSRDWLSGIEAGRASEREARMEASNSESLLIAKSAKNAAWVAAMAAIAANVMAAIAIVVSVMALVRGHG